MDDPLLQPLLDALEGCVTAAGPDAWDRSVLLGKFLEAVTEALPEVVAVGESIQTWHLDLSKLDPDSLYAAGDFSRLGALYVARNTKAHNKRNYRVSEMQLRADVETVREQLKFLYGRLWKLNKHSQFAEALYRRQECLEVQAAARRLHDAVIRDLYPPELALERVLPWIQRCVPGWRPPATDPIHALRAALLRLSGLAAGLKVLIEAAKAMRADAPRGEPLAVGQWLRDYSSSSSSDATNEGPPKVLRLHIDENPRIEGGLLVTSVVLSRLTGDKLVHQSYSDGLEHLRETTLDGLYATVRSVIRELNRRYEFKHQQLKGDLVLLLEVPSSLLCAAFETSRVNRTEMGVAYQVAVRASDAEPPAYGVDAPVEYPTERANSLAIERRPQGPIVPQLDERICVFASETAWSPSSPGEGSPVLDAVGEFPLGVLEHGRALGEALTAMFGNRRSQPLRDLFVRIRERRTCGERVTLIWDDLGYSDAAARSV